MAFALGVPGVANRSPHFEPFGASHHFGVSLGHILLRCQYMETWTDPLIPIFDMFKSREKSDYIFKKLSKEDRELYSNCFTHFNTSKS